MLVVVGGNSRNIGKTSVMVSLIRGIPEAQWTAVKITQYGNDVCSDSGADCECAPRDTHPYALSEETSPNDSDSGRYLGAGAARSFWLRTAQGQLGYGMEPLHGILAGGENTILESNSVLQFIRPHLYIVVLDFAVDDVKESLRHWLDRADALAIVERGTKLPPWKGIPERWIENKRHFLVRPPDFTNEDLVRMVRERVTQAAGTATTIDTP